MATTSTEGLPEGASATATTPAAAAQPTDTQAAPSAAPAKTEAKPADDDNDEDSEFDELDGTEHPPPFHPPRTASAGN